MGHMLNNTLQDVLVRKARMEGRAACWVPGTDHASIATEAKVVAMLKAQGIDKKDLTRQEFLAHAWEWTHKYGGIILEQLKKLGASCDWDRTRFTMEDSLSAAVIQTFVDLHDQGLIYRGTRMVNWDPQGRTAVSDEEVLYRESQGTLYHVRYALADSDTEGLVIATTRPETILGDTAICVHPDDERYRHLVGQQVRVPFTDRTIPVLADAYVDPAFGTGCLKVTPAHDLNDYEIGLRHQLPILDILEADGTLHPRAGRYVGEDRFAARKMIVRDLREAGQLVKEEPIRNNVGYSERTGAVIEPRLSLQWFLRMEDLARPALAAVMDDEIRFHPAKFKNMYRTWMEGIRDWCISRQLWWGHRIPAWYDGQGHCIVAPDEATAYARYTAAHPDAPRPTLTQDEDVLDTWFSSWLWPISVFDGITQPDNPDVRYFYPTHDLVTAPEIIFFWVARMIMAGYHYRQAPPFRNVYFTGIVRDKQRRKMSKSLGNSPDPLDLIGQYGADGVRTGMLFSSPAGNDLLFDEKLCEQGRNFANKIWNAYRLVEGWQVDDTLDGDTHATARAWFAARFARALAELEQHFADFRISDALMTVYKLVWDDFCAWYLEMVKPAYDSETGQAAPIDATTHAQTIAFFEDLVKVLHPFMPFLTEELWHAFRERGPRESLCVTPWPTARLTNDALLAAAEPMLELIAQVRMLRNERQLSPKLPLELYIRTDQPKAYDPFRGIVARLANVSDFFFDAQPPAGAASLVVKADEIFVPISTELDPAEERQAVAKELEYYRGFLASIEKKLGNERFVRSAPADVVAREQQKKADAQAKLRALEGRMEALKV